MSRFKINFIIWTHAIGFALWLLPHIARMFS